MWVVGLEPYGTAIKGRVLYQLSYTHKLPSFGYGPKFAGYKSAVLSVYTTRANGGIWGRCQSSLLERLDPLVFFLVRRILFMAFAYRH